MLCVYQFRHARVGALILYDATHRLPAFSLVLVFGRGMERYELWVVCPWASQFTRGRHRWCSEVSGVRVLSRIMSTPVPMFLADVVCRTSALLKSRKHA